MSTNKCGTRSDLQGLPDDHIQKKKKPNTYLNGSLFLHNLSQAIWKTKEKGPLWVKSLKNFGCLDKSVILWHLSIELTRREGQKWWDIRVLCKGPQLGLIVPNFDRTGDEMKSHDKNTIHRKKGDQTILLA